MSSTASQLAQRLAEFAQPLVVDRLADQRALDVAGAQRRRAQAAEGQRRAGDFAGAVFLDERRRRDNGEIAVAAGKLDEGSTVPLRPAGKRRAGQKLIGLQRRRHIGDRESGEIDLARAVLAGDRELGVERGSDRDQLGGRIEMAQRAAERAAVAGLAVPDLGDGFVHQRAASADELGEFDVALARHRADLKRTVALADVAQPVDAVEIDDMVGQHVTHSEHRHQRLAAGEHFGVVEARQQRDGVGGRARIVIGKCGRLHAGFRLYRALTLCQNLCTSSKT